MNKDHLTRLCEAEDDLMKAAKIITHLTEQLSETRDAVVLQAAELSELRVQCRFLMGVIKIARPGVKQALVGPDGKPKLDLVDGLKIYRDYGGRDLTLNLLGREMHDDLLLMRAQELQANGDQREISAIVNALREDDERRRQSGSDSSSRSDPAPAEDARPIRARETRH